MIPYFKAIYDKARRRRPSSINEKSKLDIFLQSNPSAAHVDIAIDMLRRGKKAIKLKKQKEERKAKRVKRNQLREEMAEKRKATRGRAFRATKRTRRFGCIQFAETDNCAKEFDSCSTEHRKPARNSGDAFAETGRSSVSDFDNKSAYSVHERDASAETELCSSDYDAEYLEQGPTPVISNSPAKVDPTATRPTSPQTSSEPPRTVHNEDHSKWKCDFCQDANTSTSGMCNSCRYPNHIEKAIEATLQRNGCERTNRENHRRAKNDRPRAKTVIEEDEREEAARNPKSIASVEAAGALRSPSSFEPEW